MNFVKAKNLNLGWAEFFCGGGMVRAALEPTWNCLLANDIDPFKIESYNSNWPSTHLIHADIKDISARDIPDNLMLAWASTPCQNFSSAGKGTGLLGDSSSAFYGWWNVISEKIRSNTAPTIIVLENVIGLLKSRRGADFNFVSNCFASAGYKFGSIIMDAVNFLPQSRPRVFIVAIRADIPGVEKLTCTIPDSQWHPNYLIQTIDLLPSEVKSNHVWWSLPPKLKHSLELSRIIEHGNDSIKWHSRLQTEKLLSAMSQTNLDKLAAACEKEELVVGTIFRRMRPHENGKSSRSEVRFDGVAGCLRASDGGSSRQILIFVEGQSIRTRHLTPRECARLMGLSDDYLLPSVKTHAMKLVGDGVVVPVVQFLNDYLLLPLATLAIRHESAEHAVPPVFTEGAYTYSPEPPVELAGVAPR